MSKGALTRERILDRAVQLASRDGLDGVSIGALATDLGLSKSGLFAHFGSKEELDVEVLRNAAAQFEQAVVRPALRMPRGLPRLRKAFELWLRWINDPARPGGCIFVAAAAELDDRPGRARDYLVEVQQQLLATLARSARLAIEEGHLRRDTDVEQLAFEIYGIVFAYNHARRLLRDRHAEARARKAFDRLLAAAST